MRVLPPLLVLIAGCGRFGFDGTDSGSIDAPPDSAAPVDPRIVTTGAAGHGHDVVFDGAGNLLLAGDFSGTLTLGGKTATAPGSMDGYIALLGPDGVAQRLWTGGVSGLGSLQNLALLPDGSLVASGYFSGVLANGGGLDAGGRQAALVTRFAPEGTLVLAEHYRGSQNLQARGGAASADRLAIVGVYAGQPTFGASMLPATTFDNGFVATMNLAGGGIVTRAFNGSNDIYVNDVAFGPGGDVYVGGRFNTTTNFGGGPVAPQSGGSSVFVARYDSALALRWVRTFATSAAANNLAVLPDGDCIAGGDFGGSLTIDSVNVTSSGGYDGWVARFDGAAGLVQWLQPLGGPNDDYVASIALSAGDRIAVAGEFQDSATFAGHPLVSDGSTDGYVVGLAGNGSYEWSKHVGGAGVFDVGLGGMTVDRSGLVGAIAVGFSGDMSIDGELVTTAAGGEGAAIVFPIPR